jgi:hypothetical protein
MVQKEGRLQAITCAAWTACDGPQAALNGQMNHLGARRAPVALGT